MTVIKENCGVIVTVFHNMEVITQSAAGSLASLRRALISRSRGAAGAGPSLTGDKVNKCAPLSLIINKCDDKIAGQLSKYKESGPSETRYNTFNYYNVL